MILVLSYPSGKGGYLSHLPASGQGIAATVAHVLLKIGDSSGMMLWGAKERS